MKKRAVIVFPAVLLTACFGGRVEREPPAPLPDFAPQAQVRELWSAGVLGGGGGAPLRLSPYLDGGVIYAADARGRVSALEADSGRRLWEAALDLPVTGATGAGDGVVVVGTKKGQVVALNKEDGSKAWSAQVSSEVQAPPAVQSGVVVVQTVDGKLAGLAVRDGKRLWLYERTEPALSLLGTSGPLVIEGHVLAGFAGGKVAVLALQDGKLLWEYAVSQPRGRNEVERMVDVDAAPLVVRDTLFAANYQGKIIAVDLRTGRLLWARDVSTFTGLGAGRGNVYVTDDKGNVLAFDQASGASVWKQDKLHARDLSAPIFLDGYIAVGDFQGYVHWLAAEDGRFVARYQVGGGAIRSRAVAAGGTLYIASQGGTLAALRLQKP